LRGRLPEAEKEIWPLAQSKDDCCEVVEMCLAIVANDLKQNSIRRIEKFDCSKLTQIGQEPKCTALPKSTQLN
jgi:hypothetical protein